MKNQGDNLKLYLRKTTTMVGFIALCATFCVAQTFEQLKSFGSQLIPNPKKLFEGADGAFYGLTSERILKLSKDGVEVNALFRLTNGGPAGVPLMDMIEGEDDKLYCVTSSGGRLGGGTVFSLGKDGTGLSIVHDFDLSQTGQWPFKLLAGNDGFLLGLTGYISSSNKATIFRLRTDGSGYSVLRTLGDSPGDPADPRDLIRGTDGLIYGVSAGGGAGEYGTLFRLNADGSAFTVLLDFEGGAHGHTPALVIEGTDGILYGTSFLTTESGEHGAVFRVSKSGDDFHITSTYTITGDFDFQTGLILEGRDGALYGTTNWRNHRSEGGLFRINKDGSGFTVLHSVAGGVFQAITRAKDGFIYGTTSGGGAAGGGILFQLKPDGAEFNVLREFDTPSSDGVEPITLLLGHDGVLYGAAYEGGYPSQGTIFRVNPDGTAFRVLRRFSQTNEGEWALALADGRDGYLYGSTLQGGALGGGTLYKIRADGSELTVLRNFREPEPNFSVLPSDLILATDGALYGILRRGESAGAGSLFKINRDGSGFTHLQQFETSLSNSLANPYGLTEGSDGLLYGCTFGGGPNNPGVIYSLSKEGSNFTVLHHFDASRNGWAFGGGPLISAADGTLFGASSGGGAFDGGMVFRLNKDGTGFTVLRSFPVRSDYPINPRDLALGKAGYVYGVTTFGGDFDAGMLFRMRPDGSDFVIVHHFGRNEDGFDFDVPVPNRIVSSADGTIYGITARGGESASGSIYRLLMPADDLRPRLGIFQDLDPALQFIELRGLAEQNYQIEWSEDLHVWTEVFTLRTGTNGITGKSVPRTSPQQFFRAVQR